MTFVKVRLKLETLEKGDFLEILVNEGDSLVSLTKTIPAYGYSVKEILPVAEHVFKILVEK